MPRTEVYQLRLTRDEKDRLASEAAGRDISIALLMRRRIGLDSIYEPPPKATGVVAGWPEGKTFTEASEADEVTVLDAKEITRLARQRHGHLPLSFAERKVREELG